MVNILLIGSGAREHAIAEAVMRSKKKTRLFSYMSSKNPGIKAASEKIFVGSYGDIEGIASFAKEHSIEYAIIGPESPLNEGAADALMRIGISSLGPTKSLARLETSKSFTRQLMEKYSIPGNPRFKSFSAMAGVSGFIDELESIVIKPDGLTGGKGVKVQGEHFKTKSEALEYCKEVLNSHSSVIVEEKLEGEEFSLQCITDGITVVPTPPVQDHKRRFAGDTGPNTGGMGTYSDSNHLLPFITKKDVDDAILLTKKVARAIKEETGELYKGVMYGGFMATRKGIKLIEYNARFGDPEAMNTLPLLKTDIIEICQAVAKTRLSNLKVEFENMASVCKYVVPVGYAINNDSPGAKNLGVIEIGNTGKAKLYFASVEENAGRIVMRGSRAIGVVGIAKTLDEAEGIAEAAIKNIKGNIDHRADIGTKELIEKRINHMKKLRG